MKTSYIENSQTPPTNRGLNLHIGLDWLTWTHTFEQNWDFTPLDDFTLLADDLAQLFGDRFNWSDCRQVKIGQWYNSGFFSVLGLRAAYNILSDGRLQAIFQLSGSIVNSIPARQFLRFCAFRLYPLGGFCSRLDIFADDYSGHIASVRSKILALCRVRDTELISGFRTFQPMSSGKVGDIELETLYLGSRQSNKFTRIYDKTKENKREENGTKENGTEWNKREGSGTEENRQKRRDSYRQKRREERREEKRIRTEENTKKENDKGCRDKAPDTTLRSPSLEIYTRWETEYKSETSNSIFKIICEFYRGMNGDDCVVEKLQGFMKDLIFSGYQFFDQRLNASLDRKNIIASWWSEFLELISHVKTKLPTVKPVKTIERTISFLERQVATSLALARRYMGVRYSDWLNSLYRSGDERLTDIQLLMLELNLENS